MLENLFLIFMLAAALVTVATKKLMRTVIYMGVFSLASAFVFLLYSAPDVAIAQTIIAAAITTALYLVAIKKIRSVTIFFVNRDENQDRITRPRLLGDLELYLIQNEIEPQIISTDKPLEEILNLDDNSFIVEQTAEEIRIYTHAQDRRIDEFEASLRLVDFGQSRLRFLRHKKELT